jgi:gliding motility-associated-like protein
VVLTASPGASYFWVPGGQTTQSITVSQSGLYGVTVSDANGCTSIAPAVFVDVNNGNLPPAEITVLQGATSFCLGGSVTLSANVSAGLNVQWGPSGSSSPSITVFNDGLVTLTLTDQNGCQSQTDTIDINVFFLPPAFITVNGDLSLCSGDSVQLVAPFGSGLNYLWSNGATDSSIFVDDAGNYTVTVTNSNNCSATSGAISVIVNQNPATPEITVDGNISCFQGSVTLISDQTGGNQWSTGETTDRIVVTQPGTYLLSFEDANGCKSGTDTVTITSSNNLEVSLTSPVNEVNGLNVLCFNGTDGKAEAVVNGGSEPYSYLWSNGASGAVIDGLKGGEQNKYSVTVTDANGCTAVADIVLTTPENAMENIPDAFSPDGDGINERYIIPGIESYERVELAIFNRWGNEVYNSNGAYRNESAWDGRGPNGQQVPDGTYFVVIKATSANCGTFEEPRYVEIRRK